MVLIETSVFTKQVIAALSEEEYRMFQRKLVEHPNAGKTIAGSGGLRKIRWSSEGRGKRGGVRVIYHCVTPETILLLFLYPKNVQDDLTPDQLQQLRKIVEKEYHARGNI